MSASAGYFRLGLFVIVGTLTLLAGVVYLGAGAMFEARIPVESVFLDEVSGLDVGAPVKFRGVTVGKVERIGFLSAEYQRDPNVYDETRGYVHVVFGFDGATFEDSTEEQLRERFETAVENGLRARVASAGITGTAFLKIEFLDPQQYPAPDLPWQPTHLYIPAAPGAFGQMLTSMENTLRNLEQVDVKTIGDNLNKLLVDADQQINDLQISEVRERVVGLVDDLRGSNAKLKELLSKPELNKAIDDAGAAIAGVRKLVDDSTGDVEAAIKNLRSATERVDALLADKRVDEIIQGLAATSEQLPPAAIQIRRSLQTINNLLREEQQDIAVLIRNLRVISEDLASLSGEAKDNPSRILFGEPPPQKSPGE